jgi:mono/diheme cytochrome c family protein
MNARNLVFGADHYAPPTSPVSYPYIWGIAWFGMFHYDGNTNSFMERNTGQSLGLGAIFNPETFESTVRPRDLHKLESYARKLNGPAWPFGPIDQAKAARGAEIYQEHCANCHSTQRVADSTKSFTWEEIKTDRIRLTNVAKKVGDQPYYTALDTALKAIKQQAYKDNGITPEEAADFEGHVQEVFQQTDKFIARPLVSAWASPPFLHNGSVPRMYDLLLPKEQRPSVFSLGSREYDPEKLGYVLSTSGEDGLFLFDTSKVGNDNSGHEFGTDLPEADRMALIEYLKTI